jgi:hypothetical protein
MGLWDDWIVRHSEGSGTMRGGQRGCEALIQWVVTKGQWGSAAVRQWHSEAELGWAMGKCGSGKSKKRRNGEKGRRDSGAIEDKMRLFHSEQRGNSAAGYWAVDK